MWTQRAEEMLGYYPSFDVLHHYDRVVSVTPKEIPWYSFLLETE